MPSSQKFSSAHGAPSKGGTLDKSKDAPTADRPAIQPKKMPADEMAKYGITRVTVDYYHYGAFRYTNLQDARAQAKRTARRYSPVPVGADDFASV